MQKEKNAPVLNEFDWDLYSDCYNGSNLSVNKKIKTDGKGKTKVYSHENYAQDLFDAYISKNKTYTPKDEIVNTIIEKIVDLIKEEYHILAKEAKDIAAFGVIISIFITFFIWLGFIIYFWDKID